MNPPPQFLDAIAFAAFIVRRQAVKDAGADKRLMWDQAGIRHFVAQLPATGVNFADLAAVAIASAADLRLETPRLMLERQHAWTYTSTGEPEKPKCPHGHALDSQPGAQLSSLCEQCMRPPDFVTAKEAGLKAQAVAARELNRDARRQEQAQQTARRNAAHAEAKNRNRGRLDAARAELHQGETQ